MAGLFLSVVSVLPQLHLGVAAITKGPGGSLLLVLLQLQVLLSNLLIVAIIAMIL